MSGAAAGLLVLGVVLLLGAAGRKAAAQQPAAVSPLRTAGSTDIATGRQIFESQCAWCHGTNGVGGTGPSLQGATLRHAANDKALVDIVRTGIPGTDMPGFTTVLTERTAWQTAAYVRTLGRVATKAVAGDAKRGAALYESAGCGGCHVIAGRGTMLGPELTSIGALRGASHLRESIVNPAATHPAGYLVVRATTNAGREIRGIRLNEDVFWIHIRDAGGTVHVLEKSDLAKLDRELDGTLMPSYASRFSAAELDDLVAYLSTLRGQP
jgi:putative heme-binding domain-containing protein